MHKLGGKILKIECNSICLDFWCIHLWNDLFCSKTTISDCVFQRTFHCWQLEWNNVAEIKSWDQFSCPLLNFIIWPSNKIMHIARICRHFLGPPDVTYQAPLGCSGKGFQLLCGSAGGMGQLPPGHDWQPGDVYALPVYRSACGKWWTHALLKFVNSDNQPPLCSPPLKLILILIKMILMLTTSSYFVTNNYKYNHSPGFHEFCIVVCCVTDHKHFVVQW